MPYLHGSYSVVGVNGWRTTKVPIFPDSVDLMGSLPKSIRTPSNARVGDACGLVVPQMASGGACIWRDSVFLAMFFRTVPSTVG